MAVGPAPATLAAMTIPALPACLACLCGFAWFAGPAQLAAADQLTTSASPEEIFAFKVLNDWRVDPDSFDIMTTNAIDIGVIDGSIRNWGSYISRVAKSKSPMPTIAWSADLALVAQASLARFKPAAEDTPHDPAPDFTAAKIAPVPGAALLLAEGHADLRHLVEKAMSHPTATVAVGPNTYRTHTREYLMTKEVTSCGVAVARTGKTFKVAIVFGSQPVTRSAFGIAYRDSNRNGEFDQGEPLVPAELAVAGAAKGPAKAGLWVVALGDGATEVACTVDGLTRTTTVAAATVSAWLPVAVAEKTDVADISRMLATVAKVVPKPDEDTPDKSVFDLYFRLQRARLDDKTATAAQKAVADVASYVERARKDFVDVIGEEKPAILKKLEEIEKRWRRRGPDWIAFGKTYIAISKEYGAWCLLKPGEGKVKAAREFAKLVDKQQPVFTDAALWLQLLVWKGEVERHIYASERAGKK